VSRLTESAPPGGRLRTPHPGWPRGPLPVGASRRDPPPAAPGEDPNDRLGTGVRFPPPPLSAPHSNSGLRTEARTRLSQCPSPRRRKRARSLSDPRRGGPGWSAPPPQPRRAPRPPTRTCPIHPGDPAHLAQQSFRTSGEVWQQLPVGQSGEHSETCKDMLRILIMIRRENEANRSRKLAYIGRCH
jgi:hypothetical protein